jgi:hypothetical protein
MNRLLSYVFAFAVLAMVGRVGAQTVLYNMEGGTAANPDGFAPNGGGVTISQDTFGATDTPTPLHSMKYSVVAGATFVGALSQNIPAVLNDPSNVGSVSFDLSLNPAEVPFSNGFDVIGITVFGASQPGPGQQFGLQAQFAPFVHVDGLAPGTYHETIALTGATNPLTFDTNQTYSQIFGSGANQLIPAGFEFFLNKSNTSPSTVYIDSVTVSPVPEPASLGVLGIGSLLLMRRRRAA